MSSDPIADMLVTIKNGGMVGKKVVEVPLSKIKVEMLKIFKERGFIEDYRIEEDKIKINLRYLGQNFAILSVKRVSKPGVRTYTGSQKLKVKATYGVLTILSTSQGLMPYGEAKKRKLGGEILCQIS